MNKSELIFAARFGLETRLRELEAETEKVKAQLRELDAGEPPPGPKASPIAPVEENRPRRKWSLRQRRRFLKTMRRKRAEKEE
jgi:hypothetical protein